MTLRPVWMDDATSDLLLTLHPPAESRRLSRPIRPPTGTRPPICTKHVTKRYGMTAPGGCPTTPVSAYLIGPLPSG